MPEGISLRYRLKVTFRVSGARRKGDDSIIHLATFVGRLFEMAQLQATHL